MVRSQFLRLPSLLFLVCCACAPATGGEDESRISMSEAVDIEKQADDVLVSTLRRWNAESMSELLRIFDTLSEDVAMRAVWMTAQAPARFDSLPVLARAVTSKFPPVRAHAADVLIALGTPDARRLVFDGLTNEKDENVVRHIVDGLANPPYVRPAGGQPSKPTARAVRNMIDIMFIPNLMETATATAAAHLRRLTRSELPDNPVEWRDWWLDNQQYYD